MKIILIILCITLIVVNFLNIDFDNIANLSKNKTYLINLLVSILLLIYFLIANSKK